MKYTPKPSLTSRIPEARQRSPDLSRFLRRRSPLSKTTRKSKNESSSDSEEDRWSKMMRRHLAGGGGHLNESSMNSLASGKSFEVR
jgi:hypothetical protein